MEDGKKIMLFAGSCKSKSPKVQKSIYMKPNLTIIRAVPGDASALSELTKLSKDHWGYGAVQIALWKEELTILPEYIAQYPTYNLLVDGTLAAYYSYKLLEETTVVLLDNIFIHPDYIGKGYGQLLMEDFFARTTLPVVTKFRLYSDPHAETFYQRFGFVTVGQHQSSIPNRFLPIMEKVL